MHPPRTRTRPTPSSAGSTAAATAGCSASTSAWPAAGCDRLAFRLRLRDADADDAETDVRLELTEVNELRLQVRPTEDPEALVDGHRHRHVRRPDVRGPDAVDRRAERASTIFGCRTATPRGRW